MCQSLPPSHSCAAVETNDCTSDESCQGSQMCCFDGCKRTCSVPSLYTGQYDLVLRPPCSQYVHLNINTIYFSLKKYRLSILVRLHRLYRADFIGSLLAIEQTGFHCTRSTGLFPLLTWRPVNDKGLSIFVRSSRKKSLLVTKLLFVLPRKIELFHFLSELIYIFCFSVCSGHLNPCLDKQVSRLA